MAQIKFSHRYTKMTFAPFGNTKAYVLDVWALNRKSISQAFIDFDTKFELPDKKGRPMTGKFDHFKLPPAEVYLVIMLWTDGSLWTTIRSASKEKLAFYKGLIGKEVDIIIKEDKSA